MAMCATMSTPGHVRNMSTNGRVSNMSTKGHVRINEYKWSCAQQ